MRYSEALQGFSEDALKEAAFGREVLSSETHFFVHGNVPHIALVLQLASVGGGAKAASFGDRRDQRGSGSGVAELEAIMPEATKTAYLALKDWRNRTSRDKGVPAYAVARNRQLAEIVMKAPKTVAALREVDNCGEGFCKQYGAEIVKMLAGVESVPYVVENGKISLSGTEGESKGVAEDSPSAAAEGSPDGASSSKKAKRGSKENSDGVREGELNLA